MEEVIRTLLVDDDKISILTMKSLLEKNFPKINIIGSCETVADAVSTIDFHKPDLVLLDIHLPDGEGFEVIDKTAYTKYKVIFITAHDKYALKAFEFSALHYLMKPITYDGLKIALDRYAEQVEDNLANKLRIFRDSLKSKNEKIIIPSIDGLNIVQLNDILRLEADDVYTHFYMTDGKHFIASKPLNNYEKILDDLPFSRVHAKHLINLAFVKRYVKGKGGSIIMQDNTEVEVSVRKKAEFIEKLKNYARYV